MNQEGIIIYQDISSIWGALSIVILFLVVICIISVLAIIFRWKQKMIQTHQAHEIAVMDKKFEQKLRIEELLKQERDQEWIRDKDDIKRRLDELCSKRNDVTPFDMKHAVLLYLILSGNNNNITADNLDDVAEKINKIYEMVNKYAKD